ncbi:hypothetical protein AB5N19_12526 [Seiridium cardinale]|uniref:F-box domain-containing protein n=1 Tax=Seiridium cardinale TaxID=138064 RepID=A0ABR2XMD5_9PEZI
MGRLLLSLPAEVLVACFSYLVPDPSPTDYHYPFSNYSHEKRNRRALRKLCQTSKRCQEIARPLLYHTVMIHNPRQAVALLLALLSNGMGPAIRNFACLVPMHAGHPVFGQWIPVMETVLRAGPDARQKLDQMKLFTSTRHVQEMCATELMCRIITMCLKHMTSGKDILLRLPAIPILIFDEINLGTLTHELVEELSVHDTWNIIRLQLLPLGSSRWRPAGWMPETSEGLAATRVFLNPRATRIDLCGDQGNWSDLYRSFRARLGRGVLNDNHAEARFSACHLSRVEDLRLLQSQTNPFWIRRLLKHSPNLNHLTYTFRNGLCEDGYGSTLNNEYVTLNTALLEGSTKLQSMHLERHLDLDNDIEPGSTHNLISCLSVFDKLKALRIDIALLSGTGIRLTNSSSPPNLANLLPKSLEVVEFIERWHWTEHSLMTDGVLDVVEFYDNWVEQFLLGFSENCRRGVFPDVRRVTLKAYPKYECGGHLRSTAGISALRGTFEDLGIAFIWKCHSL